MRLPIVIATMAAALVLAGCDGKFTNPFRRAAPDDAANTQTALPAGDAAEAPDVFSVTELGLWDGRPSLGGVWVAHPDVRDPERVVIRNPANGQSVTGALFRRERSSPGPLLQVSSDAAEALGLVAGEPTTLEVVALAREAAPASPEAATEPAAEVAPNPAADP